MERARRLRKGREFDTVYEKGTVTSGPLLVLRTFPNDSDVTRWGFAVGKRISKSAVVRNRVRRRLREAARVIAVKVGHDIVVTARQATLEVTFVQLRAALEKGLRQAKLVADGDTP